MLHFWDTQKRTLMITADSPLVEAIRKKNVLKETWLSQIYFECKKGKSPFNHFAGPNFTENISIQNKQLFLCIKSI